MSVYIKGMKLPKEKIVCLLVSPDGQAFVKSESGQEEKYQLIPVPEHSRLIDADELPVSTAVPLDGKPYKYVHIDNISAAPTIIPADQKKEGVL